MASDAAMNVRLGAKTKQFDAAINKAAAKVQRFGASVKKLGSSMTRTFTMPILLAGGASVKLAMDFEKSMTKINTLVRGSTESLDGLKKEVLDLSRETAKAPVELADGLYFIESAGLKGENALAALDRTARASAAGMGEMEDLATVGAAAQNAYGVETLTAADAIDKFGVMVRKGMFEASELSSVLGPQLGLASQLGISMDEVGAFISTYTQTTGDATSATNGLGSVMMTFAKLDANPTAAQAEALDKIKMSASDVNDMLAKDGLQATLLHLQTEFEKNGISMASMFSKSQALKGVMGVLGEQTESYQENLEAMGESQEFVDEAFATTAESGAFQMEQAMNNLRVAGTQLGEALAPVVAIIAEKITSLTNWWSNLDKKTQENAANVALWVAALGPALIIIGKMIIGYGKIVRLLKIWKVGSKLAAAAQKILNFVMTANPIGLIITAIGALIAAYVYLRTSTSNLAIKVRNFFKGMVNGVIDGINSVIRGINKYSKWLGFTIPTIKTFSMENLKSADAVDENAKSVENLGDEIKDLDTDLEDIDLDLDDDTTDDDDGGGGGSGDDGEAERLRKEKERKEKASLENIRRLNQQFNVLNAKDKQAADLISLKNQRENALAGVQDTIHAEEEKKKINELYDKKKEKLLEKHEDDNKKAADKVKSEWEKTLDKIQEGWNKAKDIANQFFDSIFSLMDAEAEKRAVEMENRHAQEQSEYDSWYETELAKIDATITNETAKKDAIAALDEEAKTKKSDLDKKQENEEKAMARAAARRDRQMKVMSAIMSTAQAVVNALGSVPPPFNFALATFVGALGAAQVATIASTPIPAMAKGGIVSGPTMAMVGEYQGASSNPEVIAPLDKLKGLISGGKQDINITGQLSGNDLILSKEQSQINRNRFA